MWNSAACGFLQTTSSTKSGKAPRLRADAILGQIVGQFAPGLGQSNRGRLRVVRVLRGRHGHGKRRVGSVPGRHARHQYGLLEHALRPAW